jgi:hypothetical protein
MAEMWKPQTIEVYESWADAVINEASDNLNEWEFGFITSIRIQLTNNKNLSEKQARILEKIYTEKTK